MKLTATILALKMIAEYISGAALMLIHKRVSIIITVLPKLVKKSKIC